MVIVNASAGSGYDNAWSTQLADYFLAAGMKAEINLAKSGADMIDVARKAVADGCRIVVAGGGDGTINAVASVLVGSDVMLGVLPLGTLNHFAKDLGIPLILEDAVRVIAGRQAIRVDTGEVNGRLFLNNSSLGLYPDIVRDREKQQRRLGRGKWLAFTWATVAALRRYPFLNVLLHLNGTEQRIRAPFIFVGNNHYRMEGFNIGERDALDSGELSLYVANRTGRFGLLALALHALFGKLKQAKDFNMLQARDILIETRHNRLRVATDGEVTVMTTPLRYVMRPASLHVIVPPSSTSS
ncbi:MAG: sphingosine kinase [Herminiimonas sp.]|nr:sphingosine kinase [Herminiimonas sp.]